jgi:hypothetical protein
MEYLVTTVLVLLLAAYFTGPIWAPFKSERRDD